MISRLLLVSLIALFVISCGANKKHDGDDLLEGLVSKGSAALNIMNTYPVIKDDFERGRIMRARARVLAMDKTHHDYVRAHQLLKKKIEPARRKLFVHYLRLAKTYEKQRMWSDAMAAYDEARLVTTKPESMKKKRLQMENRMRQLRMKKLLEQRRKEDRIWLRHERAYETPRGLNPGDEVYTRNQDYHSDALEDWADRRFDEAKRFLRRGLPEIAYVEIESFLRLQPDSPKGHKLLAEIQLEMPKRFVVSKEKKRSHTKKSSQDKRHAIPKMVTAEQIKQLVKQGELLQAKRFVLVYRRHEGKGAEGLFEQIEKKLKVKAAVVFKQGSEAFRKEELDKAIVHWSNAVAYAPDKKEYAGSLQRARQLKERLSILREQKDKPVPDGE